ncbi:transporter, major facilitator family protein, partial [Ostertagia ostertagi]
YTHQAMPSVSIHLLSLALCLSSGFQQGYIASVLNQPYLQIESFINQSWVERYDTEMSHEMLKIGRKGTALLASALYIPGVLLCFASKYLHPYFELLYLGRILWSLANGISSVNATVWIVECAPPQIRGRMASMQEFFMAIGSLITQAFGVPFSNEELWPFIFLPNAAFVLLSMVLFFVVHESPQFIIEKTGNREKARKALAAYHGVGVEDATVETEMKICEDSVTKSKEKAKAKEAKSPIQTEHDSVTVIFMPWKARDDSSKVIREAAWLGVMVKCSSFDRLGRRPLIVTSTVISFLSLSLMIIGIDLGASWKIATLIGLSSLLLTTACGIGSVSRFYAAELVPRNLLISSVSILTMFEALTKIGVEFAFYPIANIVLNEIAMRKNLKVLFPV